MPARKKKKCLVYSLRHFLPPKNARTQFRNEVLVSLREIKSLGKPGTLNMRALGDTEKKKKTAVTVA